MAPLPFPSDYEQALAAGFRQAPSPLLLAARGTPSSLPPSPLRAAAGKPSFPRQKMPRGRSATWRPSWPRFLRSAGTLGEGCAPRGAPSRLFCPRRRSFRAGQEGAPPLGAPYPASFRPPSFPPRPALEGQPVLMPADSWPRPPERGVTNPARGRRTSPALLTSHENALGVGRMDRNIIKRPVRVKDFFPGL
jgi:hypothetical protein